MGPQPFVKDFTFTGELKVGWSTSIVPIADPEGLPTQKIAIEQPYANRGRRRLEEVILKDPEAKQADRLLLIKDAIEVKIVRDGDDEEATDLVASGDVNFSWIVTEYSEEEIALQFDFDDPESMSSNASSDFDTI